MNRKCYRILVVDDETAIRDLIKTVIDRDDIEVLEAEEGEAALEIIRHTELDLLITDMVMPIKSGYDLLIEIKRSDSKLPVIVITGEPSVETAVDCIKLGAVDYISKPFDLIRFESLVRDVLAKKDGYQPQQIKTSLLNPDDSHGHMLADYEIKRIIGGGGMGTVFLVENANQNNNRQYALKILSLCVVDDKAKQYCWERFMNEAKAVSRVCHPNIVDIVDFGVEREEGVPFIVMEYIDGESLKQHITNRRQLNYLEKAKIIKQVAEALAAIHDLGICHRDVKPDNILIDPTKTVKLTDFGLAKLPESELTTTNDIMGSPAYLAPEAFFTARTDQRSDIFSLGATTYEFFVGEHPFNASNLIGYSQLIRYKEPKDPREIHFDFPDQLCEIIDKMMRKDPSNRYTTTTDVIADLNTFIESYL